MIYTGHGAYLPTYAADGDEFHSLTSGRKFLRVNGEWTELFPDPAPTPAPVISDPTPPLEEPQEAAPTEPAPKPKKTTRKKKESK